jgi:hypothetical protein
LSPSPGQCPFTHCLDCAWGFGVQFNHCDGPPTLLAEFAPCDFFFFPKCKLVLRGRHLGNVATITAESTLLKGLKENDFQGWFNNGNGGGTSALRLKGIKMMYPIIRKIQIVWT